jgi:AraC family transcriptional regulator
VYALLAYTLHEYGGVARDRRRPGLLDGARLERVTEYVDAHLDGRIVLEQLAEAAALSPFHFARNFRATTRLTPYAFVTARRMERARRLLSETSLPAAAVAARVGYANIAHFRE